MLDGFGGADKLRLGEIEPPVPAPDQILIDVRATAVNRPDIVQREGRYPPPPGESAILGLECAGTVAAVGAAVRRHRVGDRVFALLGGGGYAGQAVAHEAHALPIPARLDFTQAACIAETYITAYQNLFENARRYGRSTDTGIARVNVTYARTGPWVIVSVRDHGPGVDPKKIGQLTTPFFRGDAARTAATGAGLGLAIVEKAVQRMGGSFEITNASEGGLVAHIRLKKAP